VELSTPKSHRRPIKSRVFSFVAGVTSRNRRHLASPQKLLPNGWLSISRFSAKGILSDSIEKDLTGYVVAWVQSLLGSCLGTFASIKEQSWVHVAKVVLVFEIDYKETRRRHGCLEEILRTLLICCQAADLRSFYFSNRLRPG
jgi:hypothetical protein